MNAEIGAVGACNLVLLHPLVHEAWVGREADWDSADGRLAYTRRMYFRLSFRSTNYDRYRFGRCECRVFVSTNR